MQWFKGILIVTYKKKLILVVFKEDELPLIQIICNDSNIIVQKVQIDKMFKLHKIFFVINHV